MARPAPCLQSDPPIAVSLATEVAEPIVWVCRIGRVAAIVSEELLDARPDVGMPLGRNVVQAMALHRRVGRRRAGGPR